MKTRHSLMLSLAAFGLWTLGGCADPTPVGLAHTHDPEAEVTLCGHCGQVKESDDCCKEGAEACAKCSLHKGAVLCCSSAIQGTRDVILCRKCGEAASTDACCAEGAESCAKCSLHKGSPGCCKLDQIDPEVLNQSNKSHKHHADHDH